MWWFFWVLLSMYAVYCLAFCGSAAYAAYLEDWCGCRRWLWRRRRPAYVELTPEAEPMLDQISYAMLKKRDGRVMDLFEERRFNCTESDPPIVPTGGDIYGDEGEPIFF